MNTIKLFPFFLSALLGTSCAHDLGSDTVSEDELARGLALGKADALASSVEVYANGLGLRGAAARTLYNLLETNDAQAAIGGGRRALYAPGMGCITNGLDTYCQLVGDAQASEFVGYEATIHGSSSATALYSMLGGSSDEFVSTPWFACEDDNGTVWCGVETSEIVTLEFTGLEDSGEDFVYEGWAVSDGVPTTTDRFRNGPVVSQRVPSSIASNALYVLTIEPRRGDEPAPAATHLLAGALNLGGMSNLSTDHPAALGTDFTGAGAAYILATPTSSTKDDETQGIWFVDPAAGVPTIALPTLPEGWAYEGWVVDGNGPVSTGTFTAAMGEDSDGAGRAAGPNMFPPFPGQDFVSPARDLLGNTVVISVEPVPDNSPAPFAINPLIDMTVDNVMAPTTQSLEVMVDNRPSATASFGL